MRCTRELRSSLRREPSTSEIADVLDHDPGEVSKLLKLSEKSPLLIINCRMTLSEVLSIPSLHVKDNPLSLVDDEKVEGCLEEGWMIFRSSARYWLGDSVLWATASTLEAVGDEVASPESGEADTDRRIGSSNAPRCVMGSRKKNCWSND